MYVYIYRSQLCSLLRLRPRLRTPVVSLLPHLVSYGLRALLLRPTFLASAVGRLAGCDPYDKV